MQRKLKAQVLIKSWIMQENIIILYSGRLSNCHVAGKMFTMEITSLAVACKCKAVLTH